MTEGRELRVGTSATLIRLVVRVSRPLEASRRLVVQLELSWPIALLAAAWLAAPLGLAAGGLAELLAP